ncbi:hypothetical protein RN001_002058 [Aquatica leii]|uniref:Uncharacterized protein n=1 Tax=Aquatica leii TaxID=1421715 RepID=A0AAN7Q8B4_9COLE|nr:hypothetical protein RN001_002058 [Aquatica leii]
MMNTLRPPSETEENINLRKASPDQQEPSTSSEWRTPDTVDRHYYKSKEKDGFQIPTPFKKCLIFPDPNTETKTPKRKRKIFPAVISSEKYRQYYENELKKKSLPKTKKKKTPEPIAESSDSDVTVTYNDEDLDASDIKEIDLSVGKHVILKYEEKYYPGVILKSDAQEAEVRCMVPAGSAWK